MAVMLVARLALNLQFRIVYPFLPSIARGLGISLAGAGVLLAIRAMAGVASPVYGAMAERYGRRALMLVGLAALVLGAGLVVIAPGFALAGIAFAALGFSKASFDPAMQAYVGDSVPYDRRGRIMSILELPWSLSWFVGVPLAGLAIAWAGWRLPFAAIAVLGACALVAMLRLCPFCGRSPERNGEEARPASGWLSLPALAALGVSLCLVMANDNVFVVYGAWMESQFGLTVAALGLFSGVIAVAELAGELGAAGFLDRIGKRRGILLGIILNAAAYLALPQLTGTLGRALFGVALVFLTFEFSIVSLIPLISELAPGARAVILAANVSAMAVGRMISSLMAPRLWAAGGISLCALVSVGIALAALLLLLGFLRENSGEGGPIDHE
jgi:predicted MFS family arabinose efflux permease